MAVLSAGIRGGITYKEILVYVANNADITTCFDVRNKTLLVETPNPTEWINQYGAYLLFRWVNINYEEEHFK